MGYFIITTIIF